MTYDEFLALLKASTAPVIVALPGGCEPEHYSQGQLLTMMMAAQLCDAPLIVLATPDRA